MEYSQLDSELMKVEGKLDAGPNLYERKPIIMKNYTSELDLLAEIVKVMPIWIRMSNLHLKCQGQSSFKKVASLVGKPIRTDRATTQKDITV